MLSQRCISCFPAATRLSCALTSRYLDYLPLKTAYRAAIQSDVEFNLSRPESKRTFILASYRARMKALTGENINAGFKASEMWPVSLSKPLKSKVIYPQT